MKRAITTAIAIGVLFSAAADKTRGIGVYPGNPSENYAGMARRGLEGNRYYLDGNMWRMNRLQSVHPEGEQISGEHFDDSGWMKASVPSTNFICHVNAGLEAEPNYSDNYIHLMPGKKKTVTVEWNENDVRSAASPRIELTGFNL